MATAIDASHRRENKLDIADHLAPPPFGFFSITPHRMRLGQDADRSLSAAFDHSE
jgi:hypothetical protein